MCDDIEAFVAQMKKNGIACGPVDDRAGDCSRSSRFPAAGSSVFISRATPGRKQCSSVPVGRSGVIGAAFPRRPPAFASLRRGRQGGGYSFSSFSAAEFMQ